MSTKNHKRKLDSPRQGLSENQSKKTVSSEHAPSSPMSTQMVSSNASNELTATQDASTLGTNASQALYASSSGDAGQYHKEKDDQPNNPSKFYINKHIEANKQQITTDVPNSQITQGLQQNAPSQQNKTSKSYLMNKKSQYQQRLLTGSTSSVSMQGSQQDNASQPSKSYSIFNTRTNVHIIAGSSLPSTFGNSQQDTQNPNNTNAESSKEQEPEEIELSEDELNDCYANDLPTYSIIVCKPKTVDPEDIAQYIQAKFHSLFIGGIRISQDANHLVIPFADEKDCSGCRDNWIALKFDQSIGHLDTTILDPNEVIPDITTFYRIALKFPSIASRRVNKSSVFNQINESLGIQVYSIRIHPRSKIIIAYVNARKDWETILKLDQIPGQIVITVVHNLCATNDENITKIYMKNLPPKFSGKAAFRLLAKVKLSAIQIAINRHRLTRQSLRGAFLWTDSKLAKKMLNTVVKLHGSKITFELAKINKPEESEKDAVETHQAFQ